MKTNELSDGKLKLLSGLAALAIGCLCWNATIGHAQTSTAATTTHPAEVQEIVKLSKAKMTDDVILSYIKNSGVTYHLTADDILYLNEEGVTQPVISALIQTKSSAAPALTTTVSAAPVVAPSTPAPAVSPYPEPVSPYPGAAPAPSVAPSEPPPGSDINLGYFQQQLSPYGQWVDIAGYGQCWVPAVQASVPGWRPYLNAGHWIYTEDGWSWQSDYPWGQYAFHYGRWMQDPRFGWAWIPGYNWGPGWVAWRNAEGDGFAGWAPLPPGARFEAGVGLMWNGTLAVNTDFGLAPDAFVFIPFDHFWAHDYVGWRAPGWRVPGLFHASFVANHYGFVGGRFVFDGIGRDRIGILTHHAVGIEHLDIRDDHIMRAREVEHSRAVDFHRDGGRDFRDGGRPGGFRDHDGH